MRGRRIAQPSVLVLLWTAIATYAAGFSALSILRHRAFSTGRFDLGNMVQAVWATAHGHPLRVTDVRGDQISRLAAHVDPILLLFAPLWWMWPSADMLLVVQAVAIAAGAFPVFWLARKHLGSERAALGFALVYLLLPAVQWLTLNEFHPVALACPLLLFAFWYLDEDRLVPFAAFAVLAALTKEEIALVVAGFGIWYALARRRPAVGAAIVAGGAAWAAIAVGVVVPHFNDGSTSSFYSRYREVGGSPGGVLRTALAHPVRLLERAFDNRSLHYLAQLLVPLAGLFLFAPLVLAAALPELALNLLSSTETQTSIHFHYTAGLIPPLVVASVLGAGRLARRNRRRALGLAVLAVAVALVENYRLGAQFDVRPSVSAHDRTAARALRLVPAGAVVSATNTLGAHLSARRRILSFPLLGDAAWVAVDETRLSYLDQSSGRRRAAGPLERLRRDAAWQLVFARDGVLVFRRATA
jgi:uncharacterized membrane protein